MIQRVFVLGASGSGKTTFARAIARRLEVDHIELDSIHWQPNWTPREKTSFLAEVDQRTAAPRWAMDGNYRSASRLTWPRADTFVWLDYPMRVVFWRLSRRTFARWWHDIELWNGNRERLWEHFLTDKSLYLWMMQSWRRYRYEYPKLLRQQATLGRRVIRFHSPEAAAKWLESECE